MSGIEVTIRGGLDDGDEIVRAVICGEYHDEEQRFTRCPGESLIAFQTRVRAASRAATGGNIVWNGLPE
jgi:hypothetical protein